MSDSGTDIIAVEDAICGITPMTPVDELADTIGKLEWLGRRVREMKGLFEQQMLAVVLARGSVQIGDCRYYAGNKKTTRCIDPAGTLEAVLAATSGDVAGVAAVMVAQPFKHGAARSVLPGEDYSRLFVTEEEPELREGKAVKTLQRVDTRFID